MHCCEDDRSVCEGDRPCDCVGGECDTCDGDCEGDIREGDRVVAVQGEGAKSKSLKQKHYSNKTTPAVVMVSFGSSTFSISLIIGCSNCTTLY